VEVAVDGESGISFFAGKRVLGEVAHQGFLIEHGSKTAEEGPHAKLGNSLGILEGVAQMEDLAVVALVRVVSEVTGSTVEAEVDVADDDGSVGRQLVEVGAGVCRGQGQEDGGDNVVFHF